MSEIEEAVEAVKMKLKETVAGYRAETDSAIAEMGERVKELEQKGAHGFAGRNGGGIATKTLADTVQSDPRFADFKSRSIKELRIPVADLLVKNTITQEGGSPATPDSVLTPPDRMPGIVGGPQRILRIRDLLPTMGTSSNKVEFTRELSFTNSAAPQDGEGTAKAESSITFEQDSADVVTVAHFLKSSKQALDDSQYLQQFINQRLRYGVEVKVEEQILNGTGANHAMSGLLNSGNFTPFTPTSGDSKIDVLRKAMTALEQAEYFADGIVLNPADWEEIEILKDSQQRYILGQPARSAQPRLWGLPVVATNSISAGTFLVGNFSQAATLHDRQDAVVELGYENDDFTKNLVTVRAEARLALTVELPAALRSGTFL